MKCAIIEKDITPSGKTFLNGFGNRCEAAEGFDDQLYLRLLALEDENNKRALIITADILWFSEDLSWRIKSYCYKEFGFDAGSVLLNSSHTHCGPVLTANPIYPHWPVNVEYVAQFEKTIYQAIEEAVKSLRPAELRYSILQSHFGISRRLPLADGTGIDPNIRPNENGYYDSDLPVLAVYDLGAEKPHGIFYSYACHPSEKGGQRLSANYPGAVSAAMKRYFGSNFISVFAQGAGGDIKPRFYDRHGGHFIGATEEQVVALGEKICKQICEGLENNSGKKITLSINSAETEFYVPFDLDRMISADELRRVSRSGQALMAMPLIDKIWANAMLEHLRCRSMPTAQRMLVNRLMLSQELQIIGLCGEPVAELGRMIKNLFKDCQTIFLGYCNFVPVYIPVSRMLDEGGYESVRYISEYMVPAPFVHEIDEIICKTVLKL